MAGKAATLASRRLAFAMDRQFSKNALIDLVTDRARAELGEDASDEAVADLVNNWARPVAQHRNDRPVNLHFVLKYWDDSQEAYERRIHAPQG